MQPRFSKSNAVGIHTKALSNDVCVNQYSNPKNKAALFGEIFSILRTKDNKTALKSVVQ